VEWGFHTEVTESREAAEKKQERPRRRGEEQQIR